MSEVAKFGGWAVGIVITVADLAAFLGMPWVPDLNDPRDKWALFAISIVAFCACFWAGWYQRGLRDAATANQPKGQGQAGGRAPEDPRRVYERRIRALSPELRTVLRDVYANEGAYEDTPQTLGALEQLRAKGLAEPCDVGSRSTYLWKLTEEARRVMDRRA